MSVKEELARLENSSNLYIVGASPPQARYMLALINKYREELDFIERYESAETDDYKTDFLQTKARNALEWEPEVIE